MALDPSIFGNIGANVTPLLNPLDIQAKKIAIQNALASGQITNLDLQQRRQDVADDQQARAVRARLYPGGLQAGASANSLAPAAAAPAPAVPGASAPAQGGALPFDPSTGMNPDPTGGAPAAGAAPPAGAPAAAAAPTPAPVARPQVPTVDYLMSQGMPYRQAVDQVASMQKIDSTSAEIDSSRANALKANKEAADLLRQHVADTANKLDQSSAPDQPINPVVAKFALDNFASLGPQETQQAQQIGARLAQLAPADQHALLKSLGTTKTDEANAAAATAAEKTQTATAVAFDKAKGDLASALGSAQNQGDWTAILSKANPKVVQAMNIAPSYSPANQAAAVKQGQSSNEQVTTAQTATRDAATAANERTARQLEAKRISIEQAKFDYSKNGGDYLSNPAFMDGVVNGDIKINPRDKNFSAVEAAAKQQDPTWTADRYDTRQHFTQSITSGPLSRQIASINQGLAHLGEFKNASDKVGIVRNLIPGGSFISGDVKSLTNAADTSGHELTTMFSQGQGSQHEVDQTQNNLRGLTQDVRNAGVTQYAKLVGGRLRAIAKQYVASTGEQFPVDRFIDSNAADFLKSQNIDPYKISEDEAKTWMKSRQGSQAPAPGAPDHGIPDLGTTFNGGKVLSVTRVP